MRIPGVPSLVFYWHMARIVYRASRKAQRGRLDFSAWCQSSQEIRNALELVGVQIDISGIADGRSDVAIRWRLKTDGGSTYAGWNIDDVVIRENASYNP